MVCPEPPFDQLKVYGGVPPTALPVAVPSAEPLQLAGVVVTVAEEMGVEPGKGTSNELISMWSPELPPLPLAMLQVE